MQRLHAGTATWHEVTAAIRGSAGRRRAAIAFVTAAGQSLLPLRRGDELVVNASPPSLRAHATDPTVMSALAAKGVKVWSHNQLHAKVIVANDLAVVGSANASLSASSRLAEAVLVTDSRSAIRDLHHFIDGLQDVADQADEDFLEHALRIHRSAEPRIRIPGVNASPTVQSLVGDPPWTVRVVDASGDASEAAEETFARERRSVAQQVRGFRSDFYEEARGVASRWRKGELLVRWWLDDDRDLLMPPAQILGVRDVPRTRRCIVLLREDAKLDDLALEDVNERLAEAGEQRIHSPRVIRSQPAAAALLACWKLP